MMRLLLILVVCLTLTPEVAEAKGAWHKKKIIVRDYLPTARKADVEQVVASFNAMMPPRGPMLVYVAMPERPCDRARKGRGIAVCESPKVASDFTILIYRSHVIYAAKITLTPVLPGDYGPLCHEMMHALTDIPDQNMTRGESCIYGERDLPGAWDMRYIQKVYRKYDKSR